MITLTYEHFHHWMESYGRASVENDAWASANLFTQDAVYYENPFAEPLIGRDDLYNYWLQGAQTLKDKEASFQVLSVKDNLGIARWNANFSVAASGKRFALDCLFIVEFDENGLCRTFREWWHSQEETPAYGE
ncbi:MAG: nuclear transport factor 2 family protein [Anaerolineae bacterium]|nr:nuclear transport factor 2 family protein [Anaerolineae bacterium]NUQ06038.1 nuclear transport factor 2 family protein [Anaerolineae bacterium]